MHIQSNEYHISKFATRSDSYWTRGHWTLQLMNCLSTLKDVSIATFKSEDVNDQLFIRKRMICLYYIERNGLLLN